MMSRQAIVTHAQSSKNRMLHKIRGETDNAEKNRHIQHSQRHIHKNNRQQVERIA